MSIVYCVCCWLVHWICVESREENPSQRLSAENRSHTVSFCLCCATNIVCYLWLTFASVLCSDDAVISVFGMLCQCHSTVYLVLCVTPLVCWHTKLRPWQWCVALAFATFLCTSVLRHLQLSKFEFYYIKPSLWTDFASSYIDFAQI